MAPTAPTVTTSQSPAVIIQQAPVKYGHSVSRLRLPPAITPQARYMNHRWPRTGQPQKRWPIPFTDTTSECSLGIVVWILLLIFIGHFYFLSLNFVWLPVADYTGMDFGWTRADKDSD